jgi:hypothetical protein
VPSVVRLLGRDPVVMAALARSMVRTSTFLSAWSDRIFRAATVRSFRPTQRRSAAHAEWCRNWLHQSVVTNLLFLREFQRCLARRYRRIPLDDWLLQGKLRIEVTHCGIRRSDVRMGVIKRRLVRLIFVFGGSSLFREGAAPSLRRCNVAHNLISGKKSKNYPV